MRRGMEKGVKHPRKMNMATGGVRACEKQCEEDMVCLCASHMNTLGPWERLMQMLMSWNSRR